MAQEKQQPSDFSLVELMIVIAIIGVGDQKLYQHGAPEFVKHDLIIPT